MTRANQSPWRERTVLVTGVTGFLGCWLARRLVDAGSRVIGLCRTSSTDAAAFRAFGLHDQVSIANGSVEDFPFVRRTVADCGADTVFHLAAQSQVPIAQRSPRDSFETNTRGTWNLLEAARLADRSIRLVIASSDAVYGDSGDVPYTEEHPMAGTSPYATSKICSELLGRTYHRTYGLPICAARTSNLYGGGDLNLQRIVPGTIQALTKGEAPVIRGTGLPLRDYLYVEDAVSGYLALAGAMERPGVAGESFNFSTGAPVSVLTVVKTILRLMRRSEVNPIVLGESSNEAAVQHTASTKAAARLGWSAEFPLESGLTRTIDWYQEAAIPRLSVQA